MAAASRYGSMVFKRAALAVFVMKYERGAWKIDALRELDNCVAIVPLGTRW